MICSRGDRAAKLPASTFNGPPAADASLAWEARGSGRNETLERFLRHRWYVIALIWSARRISDRRFPCAASSSAWRSIAAISAGECFVPVIPAAPVRILVASGPEARDEYRFPRLRPCHSAPSAHGEMLCRIDSHDRLLGRARVTIQHNAETRKIAPSCKKRQNKSKQSS